MMIVRVLATLAKPALVGGTLTVAAAGAYVGYDHWRNGAPTPFQLVQEQGERLLISEFGERADTIVAVNPRDASDRTEIATIDHAPGYGTFPVLSPAGNAIAYTGLPADSERAAPDAPAQAAIVDDDGHVTLLADDIDLLIPPVWAPDGESIVVRKNTPAEDGAGSFELIALSRDGDREAITSWSSAAVFPIAFSPDGSMLYFATLNANGTDLYRVAPDGGDETLVAHLSDEIARDWKLSPDGTTLAYTVAESGETPRVVAMTLDLSSGAGKRVTSENARAELNPVWNIDGALTMGAVKSDGGGDSITVDPAGAAETLSENAGAFDLPIAWSPDGESLAVRSVEGDGPQDAGRSYVEIVRLDGVRERASDVTDALVVGWLE